MAGIPRAEYAASYAAAEGGRAPPAAAAAAAPAAPAPTPAAAEPKEAPKERVAVEPSIKSRIGMACGPGPPPPLAPAASDHLCATTHGLSPIAPRRCLSGSVFAWCTRVCELDPG